MNQTRVTRAVQAVLKVFGGVEQCPEGFQPEVAELREAVRGGSRLVALEYKFGAWLDEHGLKDKAASADEMLADADALGLTQSQRHWLYLFGAEWEDADRQDQQEEESGEAAQTHGEMLAACDQTISAVYSLLVNLDHPKARQARDLIEDVLPVLQGSEPVLVRHAVGTLWLDLLPTEVAECGASSAVGENSIKAIKACDALIAQCPDLSDHQRATLMSAVVRQCGVFYFG